MLLLILYATLALAVSFVCSLLEAVVLSMPPSYVEARAQEGTRAGRRLAALKHDVDRPLAAILSLNTIAHTVGAAGVGAQAARVWSSAAVGITSAVLTLLILVLSEIIPKTLGAVYWRRLARPAALVLTWMVWGLWPFVRLSGRLTRAIASKGRSIQVARDEIAVLAELGARDGAVHSHESLLLKSVLRFGSLIAHDIMTPRTVMRALPETTTVGAALDDVETLRFSRIPIYRDDRDQVTGYVLKDNILLRAARDEHDLRIEALRRAILTVPEMLSVPKVLALLLERSEQIALVLDEYGGTAGIVTMEDVVETVLGLEIVDEGDSTVDMRALARQEWYARARRLGILPGEEAPVQGGWSGGSRKGDRS